MARGHKNASLRRTDLGWAVLALAFSCATAALAQQPRESAPRIGRIVGTGVLVRTGGEVEAAEGPMALARGSVVELAGDYARVVLDAGGEIGVCGPARFTLLQSGRSLTVALDHGRVRPRLGGEVEVTVYSPFVVVRPISISEGPRDGVVGLEPDGAMCVRAERGAMRLENQFTGETLVIPQSGEFALLDGELAPVRAGAAPCRCEAPVVRQPVLLAEQPPPAPVKEPVASDDSPRRPEPAGALRPPGEAPSRTRESEPAPAIATPPATEPAEWRAEMPPLVFEAVRPEYVPRAEPEYALLIREVRVRPGLVFRGWVDSGRGGAVARRPEPRPARVEVSEPRDSGNAFRKVGRFFKRIFGGSSS
jgi:hypothetical protein